MSPTARVVLIGAPASGKGTQGRRLADRYGATYLSSGEMLRAEMAADTELGRRVAGVVRAGDLVADDVILALLREHLTAAVRAGGYVLDGFPRTLAQAHAAQEIGREIGGTAAVAVFLDVAPDELMRRMRTRAMSEQRTDDNDETLRHRIEVYRAQTEPLLDFYGERGILERVDAGMTVQQVSDAVVAVVERRLATIPDVRTPQVTAPASGPASVATAGAASPAVPE